MEKFPNLRTLSVYTATGADLTPVETKTSLNSLGVYTSGDNILDVSQLTGLYSLSMSAAKDGVMSVESSAELPRLRILSLDGGLGGPPVLEFRGTGAWARVSEADVDTGHRPDAAVRTGQPSGSYSV